MGGSFRWLPHHGRRHAVPNTLIPGDDGTTLCGDSVSVPRDPLPKSPHWLWPECPACDRVWRTREGIRLRSGEPSPAR
ncbi:MAG: zinc finger protein [Umezawaea sp.]